MERFEKKLVFMVKYELFKQRSAGLKVRFNYRLKCLMFVIAQNLGQCCIHDIKVQPRYFRQDKVK